MTTPSNFIKNIIKDDIESGKNRGAVITRFPPEPNGYLHIGHAKSICLNFGIAEENDGTCNLRYDDTNPNKESEVYVKEIEANIRWLGFDPKDRIRYASDYFDKLYDYAVKLIKQGKAYVCELNSEQIREYRGTLTEAGKESPYRNRSIEENLSLFERMKNGEFKEGDAVLRAKIDMNSPNLNMRDPVIYRIKYASHYRMGKKWHIYPMYDFTHSLSDSLENITHSLCTLEFEDHRPLYDWLLDELKVECHPKQIEFARLNLTYTVLSKRKLNILVSDKYVSGWDDPRMPTISGIKRRGYTPASIRDFCDRIGIAKRDSIVDLALLEHCIREELNNTAIRVMAVLNPIKVIIDNYPDDKTEELNAPYHPLDESFGYRKLPFGKEIYIEREDFMIDPPKKFFRLAPGKEVRLRYAYFIKCENVVYDDNKNIKEIHCVYDPSTLGGSAPDGRKVKGTIHWVSAKHAISAEVRLYDNLFTVPNPEDKKNTADFRDHINPNSLSIVESAKLEPSLASARKELKYQFERLGYFCLDPIDSKEGKPLFNRTVQLKDKWANIQKKI